MKFVHKPDNTQFITNNVNIISKLVRLRAGNETVLYCFQGRMRKNIMEYKLRRDLYADYNVIGTANEAKCQRSLNY